MSNFVPPELKRENAFIRDPLGAHFCDTCHNEKNMKYWSITSCSCSKIVVEEKPILLFYYTYRKLIVVFSVCVCILLLTYFDFRDCTTLQTIYADELPDSKYGKKPNYVVLPKVDMKCYRTKYSYLIYASLSVYYTPFVILCLFLLYRYL
ncbi:hypothetical protein BY458DRAFT_72111 [Sporodiniella umbellata]|nr:hypothetical protein BY458DRAFT_72111 [Sporodiniella umbellata]